MFGDLPDKTHRMTSPGVPKQPSPYFPPEKIADIPESLRWLRDFKDEISEELYLKIKTDILFRIRQPFYQFPPFYHTIIDMFEHVQVNVGATATVLTLAVPQKEMARIRFYGQDITAVIPPLPGTEWLEVEWQFRVNGAPLRDYNRFLGQRGAVVWPAETTVILDGADVFDIIVTNNSLVNNYFAWASIRGWQWSQDMLHISKEDSI
ncbi:MAG: hypothetical protein V1701_02930 [Planctomycetota bacterium]